MQIKTFHNKNETVKVDAVQQVKLKVISKRKDSRPKQETGNCKRYGMKHAAKQCPAFGKEC